MKILITGATGLVGKKLIETLMFDGVTDINILTRNKQKALKSIGFPVKAYEWDVKNGEIDSNALKDRDIIIHLAGESIAAKRWSDQQKKKILDSRIESANLILNTIEKTNFRPSKIISASAIGIYGNQDDKELNEHSRLGNGFLADVCKKWEAVFSEHPLSQDIQMLHVRIGLVLDINGGALEKMLPAFKAGIAGKLGSGKQYMSWIHLQDLVSIFMYLVKYKGDQHIFNATSPYPVTNEEFTKTLAKILEKPSFLPAPKLALEIVLGEMAVLLLEGQKVIPKKMQEEIFEFQFPKLDMALKDILKDDLKGLKRLVQYQWFSMPKPELFSFFKDEKNLEKLTPTFLGFKVLSKSTDDIQKGTIINYTLKVHGVPLKWKTEIEEFEPNDYFVDNQVSGPYTKWYHQHHFSSLAGGTLMKDDVLYKVPMGKLGRIIAGKFVDNDVKKIFSYRFDAIKDFFKI